MESAYRPLLHRSEPEHAFLFLGLGKHFHDSGQPVGILFEKQVLLSDGISNRAQVAGLPCGQNTSLCGEISDKGFLNQVLFPSTDRHVNPMSKIRQNFATVELPAQVGFMGSLVDDLFDFLHCAGQTPSSMGLNQCQRQGEPDRNEVDKIAREFLMEMVVLGLLPPSDESRPPMQLGKLRGKIIRPVLLLNSQSSQNVNNRFLGRSVSLQDFLESQTQ